MVDPQPAPKPASLFGPFLPIAQLFALGLPVLSLSRAALGLWQAERVRDAGMGWSELLLQGLRTDVVQLSLLAAPLLLLAAALGHRRTWGLWRRVGRAWVLLALLLLTYLEAATPGFIVEYDLRPNRLFVEYLNHPREVLATIWNGHRLAFVSSLLAGALALRVFASALRRWGCGAPTGSAARRARSARRRAWRATSRCRRAATPPAGRARRAGSTPCKSPAGGARRRGARGRARGRARGGARRRPSG